MPGRDGREIGSRDRVRAGVLGLGNVGSHYARNLSKSGLQVRVFDPDPQRLALLESTGVEMAESSASVAAVSDALVLALPNPDVVRSVLIDDDAVLDHMREGSLVIDVSTIDPESAEYLHGEAKQRGVRYLEAPMSGGEEGGAGISGAESASITFMCGGDTDAFQQAQPILNSIGRFAFHLGPVGSGSKVKLISNLIAGLNMAVMAEGFVLGAAAGIHHDRLFEVFRHTDARSFTMFEEFAPHMRSRDYEEGFPIDLMHKDHRLAAELGRKLGVPLLFNQLALEAYQIARSQGQGRKSHAVIVEVLAQLAGVRLSNR